MFLRLEAQRCFALWGHFQWVLIFWCGLLMLETLIDLKVIKVILAAGRAKVIFLPQMSRTPLLNCIYSATGLKSVWQHMNPWQQCTSTHERLSGSVCVCFCPLGPMRTSPTAPKAVPTPQRQINVAATRRSTQVTRNGGDAELVELNQQVIPLLQYVCNLYTPSRYQLLCENQNKLHD